MDDSKQKAETTEQIFWVYVLSYFTVRYWLGRDLETNSGEALYTNYLQTYN